MVSPGLRPSPDRPRLGAPADRSGEGSDQGMVAGHNCTGAASHPLGALAARTGETGPLHATCAAAAPPRETCCRIKRARVGGAYVAAQTVRCTIFGSRPTQLQAVDAALSLFHVPASWRHCRDSVCCNATKKLYS